MSLILFDVLQTDKYVLLSKLKKKIFPREENVYSLKHLESILNTKNCLCRCAIHNFHSKSKYTDQNFQVNMVIPVLEFPFFTEVDILLKNT